MNRYKMRFLSPDEGGGGGGEAIASSGGEMTPGGVAFEPVAKTTTGDRPLPKEKPASPGPSGAGTPEYTPSVPEAPSTPVPFDAEKFAKSFGTELGTTLKPLLEKATPAAQMSPEEAKQYLKIWEPDDAWYARYDNLDTRKDAVTQMRDGLVLQADTLNKLRMDEALESLRKEFMPHLEAATRAADEQREARLHTKYPMLAKPELRSLRDAITQDFVKNGRRFDSEAELFKALANGVEAVLKINNPEFKLEEAGTTSSGNGEASGRSGNQLPVTTPGGGGGTGRRESSDKTAKPRGLAIFGK